MMGFSFTKFFQRFFDPTPRHKPLSELDRPGGLPFGKGCALVIDAAGAKLWDNRYYDSFQETLEAGVSMLPNVYKPQRLIVNWKTPDGVELLTFSATISTFKRCDDGLA